MPVLVTHPETTPARALIELLAATGGQVRAYGGAETPVAELRSLGVICAVGSLLDEGHLESAMEQVHTVVHAVPAMLSDDPDLLVERTATVVSAAVGAGVKRLITTSLTGADAQATDPIRRAAAEIEEIVAETPFPSVVVRVPLVDSPEIRAALARTPLGRDVLDASVAPLGFADLAALLFALDSRRDDFGAGHVVLAADGREVMTLDDYLGTVGVTAMSLVGRLVERLRPGATLLADVLVGPGTSDPAMRSGWEETGVTPGELSRE
jgi:uncharacterized protein YbjT (DUF2867 family)